MKISLIVAVLLGLLSANGANAVECPKQKRQASASDCHKTWTGKVVCKRS